jgi:type I restriction enzyme S subunit
VELKETEVGPQPSHWRVVALSELAREKIKNGAFVRRQRFGMGVPFLNVADTYRSVVPELVTLERVDATDDELREFELAHGDLVFVRSSLKREGIGQCCIIECPEEMSIFDCHLMRVRVQSDAVDPKFVAYFSLSPAGRQSLITRSKTTTMTTINQKGLGSLPIPMPPVEEQSAIVRTLEAVDEKCTLEVQSLAAVDTVFKSTLVTLMSGEIRLGDGGN